MDLQLLVAFALRPRRGMALVLPTLLVVALVGCGHRRSTMRPVYVGPAPCPTTAEPGGVVPGTGAPTVIEPAQPAGIPPASATVTPPVPSGAEEPGLSPNSSRTPPAQGPELNAPSGALDRGRRTASAGVRQASLRERLRPFVNDPEDLFLPPKADRPWKYVVLHHSARAAGSYDQIDREHRKVLGWDGCGYHFVIGNGTGSPDGQIEVARRWSEQKHGIHCRNGKHPDVNEYGIGVCLVGDLDSGEPTPRQVAAARALVAYLSDRYAIPAARMESHAHLASTPTSCPGKHFPAQAILGSHNLALR
jgi:hypothetical protein